MYRIWTLFSVLLISSCSVFADKSECLNHHCIAIIDAGSSGSRLHVYAYDLDKTNTPIDIREIWNRKALPGLSTIEHEHRSIAVYMEKLFTDAPTALMPVYFYSTAGMRLLPKAHHKNVNHLVAEWFDKQYYWRLVEARTISGNEEGLFAWLATNYQLKLLDQSEKPLAGVMDIGGASVQIVVPLKDNTNLRKDDIVEIDLYGKKHIVFSHSFLGLGQNEMGHQYFDLKYCYPIEFELPSRRPGKGDAHTCTNEISILINSVHYVKKKVHAVIEANPVESWYIMGGITNLLNDKIFPLNNQTFSNRELITFADKEICHQKWSTLETTYPDNFMIYNYCMLPSFLYALIVEGYGLPEQQEINFMPPNKTADWTIGAVLQHKQT